MKQIIKDKEPVSLANYRASIPKKGLRDKKKYEESPKDVLDDLRKKLLEEQGYICCYCMSRVDYPYTKIEHFKPRSLYREKQLDYPNLFIACCGKRVNKEIFYDCKTPNKKYSSKELHCDTKKDDTILTHINLLSNIENNIKYKKNGSIFSDNKDIDKELNEVLNLNYEVLRINREDAINQVITELKSNNWTTPYLKSILEKYKTKNSKGKYRPYCEMIVYFLTKKLQSKGVNR